MPRTFQLMSPTSYAPTAYNNAGRPNPYGAAEHTGPASPKKRPEKRRGAEAPQRRRVKLILGSKWVDPDADSADDEDQGQGMGKKRAVNGATRNIVSVVQLSVLFRLRTEASPPSFEIFTNSFFYFP